MENEKVIIPLSEEFDFSAVPAWYVLCTNGGCPLHQDCLRFLAGSCAPESLEAAPCVMPKAQKGSECRWFDGEKVVVLAYGFSHLYDKVLKHDYTDMRKSITRYLHGTKMYYEYKRGDRPLNPEQQQWICQLVRSYGYDWEVTFDRYVESFLFGNAPMAGSEE
ncbi:MAG: hypothetical protein IJK87_09795 [Prevotella sp.]|nr:hypothetical protein [Prevotella sp.]